MPLVLVVEDGTGKSDANSYSSVAAADAYHESHLYASAWTSASTGTKEAALAMATRVLDSNFRWRGFRKGTPQRLEWPRVRVEREGILDRAQFPDTGAYWPEGEIPRQLADATAEFARVLIGGDRTTDDDSKGISRLGLGNGAIDITFDKLDRKQPVTDEVIRMLAQLGAPRGKRTVVPLRRA